MTLYVYLRSVAKKSRTVAQTLKKEGILTSDLENALKNCTAVDEIDHVVSTEQEIKNKNTYSITRPT